MKLANAQNNLIGRPRSEAVQRVILAATFELLQYKKVAELSVEAIAAKAGVGKNTIYRRWPNKAAIVVDLLLDLVNAESLFSDTGSVYQDFRQQMHGLVRAFGSPIGVIIRAVIAESQSDPAVFETFRRQFVAARRVEATEVLRRGIVRGELPGEMNLELLMDALYGPLYFRLLVSNDPLTESLVDELLEFVLKDKIINIKRTSNNARSDAP